MWVYYHMAQEKDNAVRLNKTHHFTEKGLSQTFRNFRSIKMEVVEKNRSILSMRINLDCVNRALSVLHKKSLDL